MTTFITSEEQPLAVDRALQKLRVAVIVDALPAPRWTDRVIAAVEDSQCAELALIACRRDAATQEKLERSFPLLPAIWVHMDRWCFKNRCARSDAFEPSGPVCARPSAKAPSAFADELARAEIDLILDMSFRAPGHGPDGVLQAEIWSFDRE